MNHTVQIKIDSAIEHIKQNKNTYIVGAAGVIVGAVTVLIFKSDKHTTIINNVKPVFNNNNSSNVSFGGYAHKFVENLDTGEIWKTVNEAADSAGVTASKMSRHLNGHTDNIGGEYFKIIGVGTAAA